MKFKGMYSALYSLYDENMKVKRDSVKALMEYNQRGGLQGFYVGGATGECVVLPNSTRIEMIETAMEYKKDSKIIAHIGAGHFDDTKELLLHASGLDVDAVASLPPALMAYYSEAETVRYYETLASLTDKPLMAYIQSFYSGDVVKLAGRLMGIPNVVGIKLTVPDYYLFEQIRRNYPDINLLNGPDESVMAGLICGADGAIGTTYNLLPKTATELYSAFERGDIKETQEKQHTLNRLIDILISGNIAAWKEPLRYLDIDPGYTVAPAIALDEEQKKQSHLFWHNADIGQADRERKHGSRKERFREERASVNTWI